MPAWRAHQSASPWSPMCAVTWGRRSRLP